MGHVLKAPTMSVPDYLAGELVSTTQHEFLGVMVYAMPPTPPAAWTRAKNATLI
jgi:hypothetical protein